MGRQRRHERPRHFLVCAGTPEEAERRLDELLRLAKPALGAPVRIDRLREALAVADIVPPTPKDQRRKRRSKISEGIVPRREEHAATKIVDIFAARGDELTRQNATRIIEQAREIGDKARGISKDARKQIEAARDIIDDLRRTAGQPIGQERSIIADAMAAMQSAQHLTEWDRALYAAAGKLIGRTVVH
jgi:hypothetical protein